MLAEHLCSKLDASEASIKFDFPYFVRKKAPVSGIESFMRYEASLEEISRGSEFDMKVGVGVPVQTLCPCSKEISRVGVMVLIIFLLFLPISIPECPPKYPSK